MWRKIICMYAPAYFWLPFFLTGFWWKGSFLWEMSFAFIIKWWRCCLYQQSPGAKLRWWKTFQKQTSIHLQKSHVFKPTSVSLVSPPTDQKEVKVQVRVFWGKPLCWGLQPSVSAPRHFHVLRHISDGVSKVLNLNTAWGPAKPAAARQGNVPHCVTK